MFSDHATFVRAQIRNYSGVSYAGRFITEALLAETKEGFIEFVKSCGAKPGHDVLVRDIDVEHAVYEDGKPGLAIRVKDDAIYNRVRINIPGRGTNTRQVVVIVDVDATRVKPSTKAMRAAIGAGLDEWCCTTDEGSLHFANNLNITIVDILNACREHLVPHSLVQCLRHHGIGEMWVMKSEREATYDWFIDDPVIPHAMKGHN